MNHYFFAFQTNDVLYRAFNEAAQNLRTKGHECTPWPELKIKGQRIADKIFEAIDQANVVVADLTFLNQNVAFEAGYAVAKRKVLVPSINTALDPELKELEELGIFDSVGQARYDSGATLTNQLDGLNGGSPLELGRRSLQRSQPLFLIEPPAKDEPLRRLKSRLKKAQVIFRIHDPKETGRLASAEAIENVLSSAVVIGFLMPPTSKEAKTNNLKVSYCCGLAFGLDIPSFIFHQQGTRPPMDMLDMASVYKSPQDIERYVNQIAPLVTQALQQTETISIESEEGILQKLELGSTSAENEAEELRNYFLHTDEYQQVISGEARLVTGRKGSGKSAIFFQGRNKLRRDPSNIVLDLKPDGYQLKVFREKIIDRVAPEVAEQIATTFWEYLLLLEIAYKILEKDKRRHLSSGDPDLYAAYEKLIVAYGDAPLSGEMDFSERAEGLVDRTVDAFAFAPSDGEQAKLTSGEISEKLYRNQIPELRDAIAVYLELKADLWILFDNIDASWPPTGVTSNDVRMLRSLIDACGRIQKASARRSKGSQKVHSVVFLRNDVFELLAAGTPDRGKDSRINLDWTDRALLAEMIRLRIVRTVGSKSDTFESVWKRICVQDMGSGSSFDYLVDHSLMRPRYLLTILMNCRSNAINLGRTHITEEDIKVGLKRFSASVCSDIGYELNDVYPDAGDILYAFNRAKSWQTRQEFDATLASTRLATKDYQRVLELLLWFGFLGVVREDDDDIAEVYIFDAGYDMKKLLAEAKQLGDPETQFCVHQAFWSHLDIKPT